MKPLVRASQPSHLRHLLEPTKVPPHAQALAVRVEAGEVRVDQPLPLHGHAPAQLTGHLLLRGEAVEGGLAELHPAGQPGGGCTQAHAHADRASRQRT